MQCFCPFFAAFAAWTELTRPPQLSTVAPVVVASDPFSKVRRERCSDGVQYELSMTRS